MIYSAQRYDKFLELPNSWGKKFIVHQDNDRAVMAAYGFPVKTMTESLCVAEMILFRCCMARFVWLALGIYWLSICSFFFRS
jgi:hypothetical protein